MYSILVKNRDGMMRKLEEKGIETRPFFYPLHVLPPYRVNEKYPIAEELSKKGINLPSATTLKEEDIEYVVNAIKEVIK